mmetsp:Transcript_43467/g.114951  ORF Transcript_43467/g.114951 Transcript_43467/m.114951 type:complete len:254 (+) Transcript_43467:97-858(+)
MSNMQMSPAMQAMGQVQNIKIKEKVRLLEAATALLGQEIEMANKYSIEDRDTGAQVFYATEETNCLAMQCKQVASDCAPWKLSVLYTGGHQPMEAFRMEKEWSCTCLCLNRPTMTVIDTQTRQFVGSITDPCTCLAMKFEIVGANGQTMGYADGGCCQWGMLCPLPCGPCAKVEFEIQDADNREVGRLTKKIPGWCKFLFSPDVDNYNVQMGGIKDPAFKTLVLALALFMDFRYFSDNKNDGEGGLLGRFGLD